MDNENTMPKMLGKLLQNSIDEDKKQIQSLEAQLKKAEDKLNKAIDYIVQEDDSWTYVTRIPGITKEEDNEMNDES